MNKGFPGAIIFEDDKGQKQIIKTPSLNILFRSEKLQESYKKNPSQKYSVNDILKMMGKLAPKKNTLRDNLGKFDIYFEDKDEYQSRFEKKRLISVKIFKLKPLVEYIFNAINGEDDDEE
jgi:hypothetical protein